MSGLFTLRKKQAAAASNTSRTNQNKGTDPQFSIFFICVASTHFGSWPPLTGLGDRSDWTTLGRAPLDE
jgi:hypothetical protein